MHPNKALFAQGLRLVLDRWSALNLAIHQGDPENEQKKELLFESLLDYFSVNGKRIEPEDLEEILLQVMITEFGIILQDESERQVAKILWELYHECILGKTAIWEKLLKQKSNIQVEHVAAISEEGYLDQSSNSTVTSEELE